MKSPRGEAIAACAGFSAALAALVAILSCGCSSAPVDTVSGATSVMADPAIGSDSARGGALIILAASRDSGTTRVAEAIADVLEAKVLSPRQARPDDFQKYDVVGFGSGIFDQMHHKSLLEAADALPQLHGKKVFIFSTSGVSREFAIGHRIDDPHTPLREKLRAKGCTIVDEFNCAGFNDNNFLKFFGGMNKGKPSEEDLERAAAFAERLREGAIDGLPLE